MRHQYLIRDILAQIYHHLQIIYIKDTFNLKEPTNAFRFFFELHNFPSAFGGLLNLTTSDHNLQDPYCRHCHTYTNELPLLDLSDDSIGQGSCELDCATA